jgi:hypothetical protein
VWFHLHEVPRVVEVIHTESRMEIDKGWGGGVLNFSLQTWKSSGGRWYNGCTTNVNVFDVTEAWNGKFYVWYILIQL